MFVPDFRPNLDKVVIINVIIIVVVINGLCRPNYQMGFADEKVSLYSKLG